MRRFLLILMAALPLSALAACDDVTGANEPSIAADSALVLRAPTAPGADVSSALDATIPQGVTPEFPQYARAWDFALRQSGNSFRFDVLNTTTRSQRPGIALSNQAFAEIREASRRRSSYADSTIALVEGASYTFRTRANPSGCFYYGKLRVVDLDPALGTAQLYVAVNNGRCDDERLEYDD